VTGFFAGGTYLEVSQQDNDAITGAAEMLATNGVSDALKEARLLWVAAKPQGHDDHADGRALFDAYVARRCAREPLSHLVGYRDFYEHRFVVSADVLDPRPDTEALIIAALDAPFDRVLDLGTGSGCILLSLLAARSEAQGVGTDVSDAALAVAKKNRTQMELGARAELARSDWFEAVEGVFDLIVSNPPYIAADEMEGLQPEVRQHEPRMALTDDADGLTAYRKITKDAPAHLTPGGRLMFEIGPTQALAVSAMMQAAGFERIRVVPDLDGRDRVLVGYMPVSVAENCG
jgi:release factor glutamine methyltransferase